MTRMKLVVCKTMEGEVEYNDGEFAEIQTNGIAGIEEGLLLATIQAHREDTRDTVEEFHQRFPVGMRLEITTTTEMKPAFEEIVKSAADLVHWLGRENCRPRKTTNTAQSATIKACS